MSEHPSDCALHNAPAMPPEPCSCGASPLFKVFGYDINSDNFKFVTHSRESLIADVVGSTFARIYGSVQSVRISTLARRAVNEGLTSHEQARFSEHWQGKVHATQDALAARGLHDNLTQLDGSPLDASFRESISTEPSIEEIRAAVAPWFEFWATLPEPVTLAHG